MAIHTDDQLSTIIGETVRSTRTDAFLTIFIAENGLDQSIGQIANKESREIFARYLVSNPPAAEFIKSYIKHKRVPEHLLDWVVDDSPRQTSWIHRNCLFYAPMPNAGYGQQYQLAPPQAIKMPVTLTGRILSIGLIDYYLSLQNGTLDELISFNTSLKSNWEYLKRTDRFFAWLDQDDAEGRRSAFWSWLPSKGVFTFSQVNEFPSQDRLLEFFDDQKFSDADKELLSQKFRKVWNQQQTRKDRTDKKQVNFILSNSTDLKLAKLSKKHGLTRTQIIEIIIDSEAKHETYIKERLDRDRRLITPL